MFNQFSSNNSVISETKNVKFLKTLPNTIGIIAEDHCEEGEVKTESGSQRLSVTGDRPSLALGASPADRGPAQNRTLLLPGQRVRSARPCFADTIKPSSVCGHGQAWLPSSRPPCRAGVCDGASGLGSLALVPSLGASH